MNGITRHVRTGKTIHWFPVAEPINPAKVLKREDVVEDFENFTLPIVAGVPWIQTHSVNNELSVVYLATQTRSVLSGIYDEDTYGLNINCYPIKGHLKKCVTIPTKGSTLEGLTGKCVCVACVKKVAEDAEEEGKDIVRQVNQQLGGNAILVTTHPKFGNTEEMQGKRLGVNGMMTDKKVQWRWSYHDN